VDVGVDVSLEDAPSHEFVVGGVDSFGYEVCVEELSPFLEEVVASVLRY